MPTRAIVPRTFATISVVSATRALSSAADTTRCHYGVSGVRASPSHATKPMNRIRQAALFLMLVSAPPAAAQSAEAIDRLAVLGKVWGFLKYNHPAVTGTGVDWDSALVASVPRIQAARSTA